ncbi:hypothetical protein VitviT2T_010213 [Vitis vinifera]|uniref:Uncharacterized protein n=1 Tax=Vitis vinifera TaxID=29760 RepID=A0ABY9C736_VITVI|nr:hypothetical protein VitviT2T_010213 [Vitis vinifera]
MISTAFLDLENLEGDFQAGAIIRDGYGKLVQRELEAQRHLIDSGSRSLGSFLPVMPSHSCKGNWLTRRREIITMK